MPHAPVRSPDARGVTAVETALAALVAAVLSVPLLVLLFRERDSGQRTRWEYLALLAAREAMYDARFLAAAGAQPVTLARGFHPLTGSPLESLAPVAFGATTQLRYPPAFERIETSLAVEPAGFRLHRATVTARWSDPAASEPNDARPREVRLVTGLLSPPHAGGTSP